MKVLALLLALAATGAAQETFRGSAALDDVVERAVHEEQMPGAVLLVGQGSKILHRKAYGARALVPAREPMTLDTIFDAASLTKVVATTSSLMKLFEQGKLRLNDPVTRYLPGFQGGKSDITIRNLLTHFSGLRPDLDLEPPWSGYETGIRKALIDKPAGPPGSSFVYSDINFVLLGEIVRVLGGKTLAEFARDEIFLPLGMRETRFLPPAEWRARIAPTEIDAVTGKPLRGVVHDPTSRFMGGVAGHAGLFTTADDLARFARMLLGEGERIFSPLTVHKFTEPESPASQPILRGLGWDIDSPFSGNRGELFPLGSYGHTGFTGTSLWIDPATKTYVILLSNSVHPHRRKPLTELRAKVATITAAALGIDVPGVLLVGYNETITGAGIHRSVARNAKVLTGLDVLIGQRFAPLQGKRVGLFTNQTGLSREGKRNVDLMLSAGVRVTALFSPEHGFLGKEDNSNVGNARDPSSGIPIWSLYQQANQRPTQEMLRDLDALVFDIQDIGARFYTYSCTMLYAMEEAAKAHKPFYVLDRPNPITGVHVEGPILDKDLESFVGCFEMPVRHGMTFGEMAAMFNAERKLGLDLHVVPMRGWERGDWLDSTGLTWVDPSPNMRSLNAALLYPGVALLEASSNYSVGRGTDAPFEQIGADWIRGQELAAALNSRVIPGVRAYPVRFRPAASNFSGIEVEGVRFVITDREAFDSVRLGLEIACAVGKLYPGKMPFEANRLLIGSRGVIRSLEAGKDAPEILQTLADPVARFVEKRRPYLLYK